MMIMMMMVVIPKVNYIVSVMKLCKMGKGVEVDCFIRKILFNWSLTWTELISRLNHTVCMFKN